MLKQKFTSLAQQFIQNKTLINSHYKEILLAHTNTKRHYHTLKHLETLFKEFAPFMLDDEALCVIGFTIFYHDSIYNVTSQNNETQSAVLAKKRLLELGVSLGIIKQVVELILLTKTHPISQKKLYNLFLDADLSILGSSAKRYKSYLQEIRKEYAIYDDKHYKKGRILVLEHFLKKEKLFQTDFFYEKYEKIAQKNIQNELLYLK